MTFGGALTLEKNGYLAAAQLSMVEVQKNHLSDSDRCCNTPNWQQYVCIKLYVPMYVQPSSAMASSFSKEKRLKDGWFVYL